MLSCVTVDSCLYGTLGRTVHGTGAELYMPQNQRASYVYVLPDGGLHAAHNFVT
jgi:hypothetical protein